MRQAPRLVTRATIVDWLFPHIHEQHIFVSLTIPFSQATLIHYRVINHQDLVDVQAIIFQQKKDGDLRRL